MLFVEWGQIHSAASSWKSDAQSSSHLLTKEEKEKEWDHHQKGIFSALDITHRITDRRRRGEQLRILFYECSGLFFFFFFFFQVELNSAPPHFGIFRALFSPTLGFEGPLKSSLRSLLYTFFLVLYFFIMWIYHDKSVCLTFVRRKAQWKHYSRSKKRLKEPNGRPTVGRDSTSTNVNSFAATVFYTTHTKEARRRKAQ